MFLEKQKIINNQCDEHVNNNDLLYEKQFGFRAAHSTSHTLFLTMNEIEMALNQKKYCSCGEEKRKEGGIVRVL